MERKMSRRFIVSIAVVSCAALFAFAPLRQGAPKAPAAGAPAPAAIWAVTFELSKWDVSKPADQQPGFMDHMANVHKMAADGVLLVGGPFLESPENMMKPTGALLIVKAESAEAAKKLCSNDGLVKNDLMKITSVRAFLAGGGAWVPAGAAPAHPPAHAPAPGGDKH
jgi:uncharacterized protein YciI